MSGGGEFWFRRVGAPAAAWLVRLLARTLRLKMIGEEHFAAALATRRPVIFVFWHEDLFGGAVLQLRRIWRGPEGKRSAAMVSRSRDGEMLAGVIGRLGMEAIRGSSSRGGVAGLLELARWLSVDEGSGRFVALALDGPRGPRRVAKPGIALLARRTGALVLPMAVSFSRQWTFNSWDRTKLARPWATVEYRFAPPLDAAAWNGQDEANAAIIASALLRVTGNG